MGIRSRPEAASEPLQSLLRDEPQHGTVQPKPPLLVRPLITLQPVTLKYPALTGGASSPTAATKRARSNPNVWPTCALDTAKSAGVSYSRLTYRCACGGFSGGGAGPTYGTGPAAEDEDAGGLRTYTPSSVAVAAGVKPAMRACRLVRRGPAEGFWKLAGLQRMVSWCAMGVAGRRR